MGTRLLQLSVEGLNRGKIKEGKIVLTRGKSASRAVSKYAPVFGTLHQSRDVLWVELTSGGLAHLKAETLRTFRLWTGTIAETLPWKLGRKAL